MNERILNPNMGRDISWELEWRIGSYTEAILRHVERPLVIGLASRIVKRVR